jgi:hypothetical protein
VLICVDEILEFHDRIDVKYWQEVKQEINQKKEDGKDKKNSR